jgi:hypothetical protein
MKAFIVNSTSSSLTDVGSLAHALSAANAKPGPDVVIISLPSEAGNLIRLTAELPIVTGPIELRGGGATISGAQLTGTSSVGLLLGAAATNSSVSNLTITEFPGTGVVWAASDGRLSNVTISGCGGHGLELYGHRNLLSSSVIGKAAAGDNLGNSHDGR